MGGYSLVGTMGYPGVHGPRISVEGVWRDAYLDNMGIDFWNLG